MVGCVAVLRYRLVSQTLVTSAGGVSRDRRWLQAILVRPIAVPEGARLLRGEFNFDNRLDALETILPRHHQSQWCAVLLWQWMSVDPAGEHAQLIVSLRQRQC